MQTQSALATPQENPELGKRKVPFTRELYVEREDFMEEPPKKYFRMFPGNEVRFMNAYFVKCNSCVKEKTAMLQRFTVHMTRHQRVATVLMAERSRELSTGFQPSMESR